MIRSQYGTTDELIKNPQSYHGSKIQNYLPRIGGLEILSLNSVLWMHLCIFKPLILKHLRRSLNIKGKFPDDINEFDFRIHLYGAFINHWYINEYTMVRINYKDSTSGKLAATDLIKGKVCLTYVMTDQPIC